MRKWTIYFGLFLILMGLISLVGIIFKINLWVFFWPLVLIAIGVMVLIKPAHQPWWQWFGHGGTFFGDTHTVLEGTGKNEEFNSFVGDIYLDLTKVEFPDGGTNYKYNLFAGDIRIMVPVEVGVRVNVRFFAGELDFFGEKSSGVMAPVGDETAGFQSADKKAYIEVNCFAGNVEVRRA